MNVGFYSPLPPARTGVADYAAALLSALRKRGTVEVDPERCDVALYHLGNNSLHADIYQRALAQPGVVVLHDAVLHHFLLGQLSEEDYKDEFVYNYGEWHRGLAEELWRGRGGSAADGRYFQFPLLRRVAEASRAVVVHNPAAARLVREHAPHTPVVEIAHLFQAPEPAEEGLALRYLQRMRLPVGAFVFGVFGYLRESKRLLTVLEAFVQLHRENPRTGLLVAGTFVSAALERAVAPFLDGPGIARAPFLSEDGFWLAAAAVDACVNLRDPPGGETSGIGIRLMGIGKPVLVTKGEETSRFPEDACVRIAPGLCERDSLYRHMGLLTSLPEVARGIGDCAAAYIRAHHLLDPVAQQYWDTLCEYCS